MTAARPRSALPSALLRHVVTVVVGIVTVAVVGRRLGPDALGVWALLGTSAFLLGLADLGTPVAAQRALARGALADARRAARVGLGAIFVVAPILVVLSAWWLVPIARAVPRGGLAVLIGLAAGVVTALGSPARGLAVVTGGAMRALAWSRGLAGLAQLVVMLGVLAVDASLLAPALGIFAAAIVETSLVWRIVRAFDPALRVLPSWPRDRREVVAIGREASAAFTINIAVAAAVRFDVVLVVRTGTLAAVAAYAIAGRAVDQTFAIAKQVSVALLPQLGEARDQATRARVVRAGVARLGGLAASALVAIAMVGTPLLVVWAGAAAAGTSTATVVAILAAAAIVSAATEIPAAALTLADRSAWRAATPIALGALVNIAIGASLAGSIGPLAVAFA
ncbi:MAG: hypothetical protein NT062_17200, partial [Proteobacteria bacterium]|nr:hypothetical protein [Pseudomonadota bacterium]